jgi:excisionase family DNA binding protein
MAVTGTVLAMKSKANEQVLAALQQVVGAALINWLDENRADVLQALRAAVAERQSPPAKMPEAKREPQFLNTAEVAARWQLHRETVRLMVRQGRLPRMSIGRRVLVPLSAILESEKQGWVPGRR